ncbi:MAG: hypothetical protein HC849_11435 [Oscillatoriales cyanobacterium RU_3_3]|nr:hypothetical protein [Oscillatoriales cyanobacterium RU_3_3]
MSQVISFRASGHFLNWLESQRMDEESLSQCCQRILKVLAADGTLPLSTECLQSLSTSSSNSLLSTEVSTLFDTVTDYGNKLSGFDSRFAAIEERLGKLRA